MQIQHHKVTYQCQFAHKPQNLVQQIHHEWIQCQEGYQGKCTLHLGLCHLDFYDYSFFAYLLRQILC